MHFLKRYPKLFKLTCLAATSIGAGCLCYQVSTTRKILNNALDTSILSIVEPTIVENPENDDFLIIDVAKYPDRQDSSLLNKWISLKFSIAKRLLILANSENRFIRKKAVRQLARIKNLEDWQYCQLADMIDPRTAVGLARSPEADHRFFKDPPPRYMGHNYDMIVEVMKEMLVDLHKMSQHPCMGYFISKAFVDVHEIEKFPDDISSYELKAYIQNHKDLIPLCLESLLHHASLGKYAKDIVLLNGLPVLMEIHNRFKDNVTITATICRIISYLSMNTELLDELFKSGWVGVLAGWVNHDDVRISIPAGKALANLDTDENPLYLQRLYPLHPSNRVTRDAAIDVVFVHGLLGGVFFTWRQRKRIQDPLGFLGKKGAESLSPESLANDSKVCKKSHKIQTSDRKMQEFMHDMEEYAGYDSLSKDYDFVWEDIPTNTNEEAEGPYCCHTGYSFMTPDKVHEDGCFTNCWPRDWLAQDCNRLRIIGVNYETNLSMWTPLCPVENVKTLEERSDELMEQLVQVEVGKRPIVWVSHSMGGLMVKCLLNKAMESDRKEVRDMYSNTKGVVFYSTPHVGSSFASFSQAAALVIWPSIEVKELQKNSPKLVKIHEKFLELVKKRPIKVVTFVETKPTLVSAMRFKFVVVEPDTGNPGCGEYYEIPLDHLGICKPASRHSFLYQKVLHLIENVLHEIGQI